MIDQEDAIKDKGAIATKKRRKNEMVVQQPSEGKRGGAQDAALQAWEKDTLSAVEQEFLMNAWHGDTTRVLSMLETTASLMCDISSPFRSSG